MNTMQKVKQIIEILLNEGVPAAIKFMESIPGTNKILFSVLDTGFQMVGEYRDRVEKEKIKEDIQLLFEKLEQMPAECKKEIEQSLKEELLKELMKELSVNGREQVYMFALAVFPLELTVKNEAGEEVTKKYISRKEQDRIKEFLSEKKNYFNIKGFPERPLCEHEDYELAEDCLILYFPCDEDPYIRDDAKIISYIHALNKGLVQYLFGEYIVF